MPPRDGHVQQCTAVQAIGAGEVLGARKRAGFGIGPRFRGDAKESLSLDMGDWTPDPAETALCVEGQHFPRTALRFRGDDEK